MTQATEPGPVGPGASPAPDTGRPAERSHLVALLEDAIDLAAVLDWNGSLRFLNRAGRRMLGVSSPYTGPLDGLALVAESDRPLVINEVLPALRADGWWTGNLALIGSGTEVPTRSTLRVQPDEATGETVLTWLARDISTEKRVFETLRGKIFEDELTRLPHRSIFLDRLDLSLRRTRGGPGAVVLTFISLDRFKDKNDRFGRVIGDELLRAVGQRLGAACGPADTAARWGGDEFVFLSEGTPAELGPMAVATRVAEVFATPFTVSGIDLFQTASIGATLARAGETTTDQVLRQAEAAGQMAKQRGGEAIHLFDEEMQARAQRRAQVEDALRGAGERGELILHFQPEVSLRTNEIVAVEALLRWQHPEWGLVAPAEFIPVAELSSLILEVGAFVLDAGMRQRAEWQDTLSGLAPTVAINISPKQFIQDDFAERVAATLERTGADPSGICLEITESVLMNDLDGTVATLRQLKGLGVLLAVDDFGTGYSSLSYLRAFPVDIIKVDQSFVSGLGKDPEDSAIVEAVVRMGQALRLTTVAEGVETAHHLIELRELDCDIAQGYHFARPAAAEAITPMLRAGKDWLKKA
ncbi:MAG TPA: bifunctional diguanylate cyclase/phosphodiesterase [Acidimicrobiales bacterium]|nr:bifunctional diguanylate cyclase/phosphodiesterase [Acidimicrobiales bacterium]